MLSACKALIKNVKIASLNLCYYNVSVTVGPLE